MRKMTASGHFDVINIRKWQNNKSDRLWIRTTDVPFTACHFFLTDSLKISISSTKMSRAVAWRHQCLPGNSRWAYRNASPCSARIFLHSLQTLLIFVFKMRTLDIWIIYMALAPTTRRIIGCAKSFCSYLPDRHKLCRGNVEKQAKILLRASICG